MGSFQAPVVVPELKQAPLKVSSVLLSSQLQTAKDSKDNPLIRNGEQLVPNLTHIVSRSQKLYFYYEVYESQFDEQRKTWEPFEPEMSFETAVVVPEQMHLEGYDVVSFYARTSPECSPLSCNHMAETIPVNRHCLLASFDEAKSLLEGGAFDRCEHGPYRIFAVYSCTAA